MMMMRSIIIPYLTTNWLRRPSGGEGEDEEQSTMVGDDYDVGGGGGGGDDDDDMNRSEGVYWVRYGREIDKPGNVAVIQLDPSWRVLGSAQSQFRQTEQAVRGEGGGWQLHWLG